MDDTGAVLARARVYVDQDRGVEALALLERHANPALLDDVEWWQIRLEALLQTEDWQGAIACGQAGLARDPDDLVLITLTAAANQNAGRLGDAEALFRRGLGLHGDHPLLLARYGVLLALGGHAKQSDALLERARALEPDWGPVRKLSMAQAAALGRTRKARRFAEEQIERAPHDAAEAFAFRGALDLGAGRVSASGEQLAAAASLDGSVLEAQRDLFIEQRVRSHPLMWPVRLMGRIGGMWLWVGLVAALFVLRRLDLGYVGGIVAMSYLAVVVWSWIAPPIVRRLVMRRLQ